MFAKVIKSLKSVAITQRSEKSVLAEVKNIDIKSENAHKIIEVSVDLIKNGYV